MMVLPSFEDLNEEIGMTKDVYDKLEERYKIYIYTVLFL